MIMINKIRRILIFSTLSLIILGIFVYILIFFFHSLMLGIKARFKNIPISMDKFAGKLVYSHHGKIKVLFFSKKKGIILSETICDGYWPSFLPDGDKIIFVNYTSKSLKIIDIKKKKHIKTVYRNKKFFCHVPSLSPDGKKIIFILTYRPDSNWGYPYLLNINTSQAYLFSDKPVRVFPFSWSADGTKVAFTSIDNHIIIKNCSSIRKEEIIGPGCAPSWSPDGKKIAYWDEESLKIIDIEKRKVQKVDIPERFPPWKEFLNSPLWVMDGKYILYFAHDIYNWHYFLSDPSVFILIVWSNPEEFYLIKKMFGACLVGFSWKK